MANKFTLLKHFTRDSSSGFSIFELLVASFMSSIILGFSLSVIVQQRRQFQLDQARGTLNQNLRNVTDLIGGDIRQGGELLGTDRLVPTFSLVNGTNGGSDSLSIQRKIIERDLTLNPVVGGLPSIGNSGGNGYAVVEVNDPTTTNDFQTALTNAGITLPVVAFIFDVASTATPSAKAGEFFVYTGNSIASVSGEMQYRINRIGGWANAYNPDTSHIYIIEERTYRLAPDPNDSTSKIMQLVVNRGVNTATPGTPTAPRTIANGFDNFQVQAQFLSGLQDNLNESGAFEPGDPDWRTMQSFNITLTAAPPNIYARLNNAEKTRFFGNCSVYTNPTCSFSLASRFLPRNVNSTR